MYSFVVTSQGTTQRVDLDEKRMSSTATGGRWERDRKVSLQESVHTSDALGIWECAVPAPSDRGPSCRKRDPFLPWSGRRGKYNQVHWSDPCLGSQETLVLPSLRRGSSKYLSLKLTFLSLKWTHSLLCCHKGFSLKWWWVSLGCYWISKEKKSTKQEAQHWSERSSITGIQKLYLHGVGKRNILWNSRKVNC